MIFNVGGGGVSIRKLWENASPTSEFPAQTVSVDVSEYEWVAVHYRLMSSIIRAGITFVPVYGGGDLLSLMSSGGTPYMRSRRISFTDNNPVFSAGYLVKPDSSNFTSEEDNTLMVPFAIYGIKGVS